MAMPTTEDLALLPPEYINAFDGERLLHTSIAFIVLPTIVFSLFIVSRVLHDSHTPWDIWILVPMGWICCIANGVLGLLHVTHGGTGRHVSYWLINDPSMLITFLQMQSAIEFVYCLAITFPKLALLSMYLKIFTKPLVRKITWFAIGCVILHWLTSGVIVWATICRPFAFKWNKSIPGGKCASIIEWYRYVSIPNIMIDLVIMLLPVSTLWTLQMVLVKKLGIFLTFLFGSLGIIVAIVRFIGFYKTNLPSDITWFATTLVILTIIEPGAYFICACIPYVRPLAYKVYQQCNLIAQRSSRHSKSHSGNIESGDVEYGPRSIPLRVKSKTKYTVTSESSKISDDRVALTH